LQKKKDAAEREAKRLAQAAIDAEENEKAEYLRLKEKFEN
jgi:hypothetical protein